MDRDMNELKSQIKDNINILINSSRLSEAKILIEEYKRMVHNDIEIYSIEAVVLILEGKLDEAEEILIEGMTFESNNFDLLYNIGYLNEVKENYLNSLLNYKKALIKNYYNIDINLVVPKINELKEKVQNNNKNKFDLMVSKLDNILFIDFNTNDKTHLLSELLAKYGINVDLAYNGLNPLNQININSNPYRKILGITNLEGLVHYASHYNYDNIYLINSPENIKNYFKNKCSNVKVLDKDIFNKSDEETIQYFYNSKMKKNVEFESMVNNNISIIIPTYNRPYYLNRVLTFMNNYKYIKPTIIVLDSSDENKKQQNIGIIRKINKESIVYKQYSSDINFYEKLNDGLKNVNNEYVALCADDDFLTEEGIIGSIKMLDEDKSLYSVKGKNLYFTYSMGNLIEYDWFEGLLSNDSVERLKEITRGFFSSLIYQVFRTEKFEKMYLFIEDNMKQLPENSTFTEYLFYFMVVVTGKVGKINVDLNIRDKSVPREIDVKNFPHAVKEGNFNDNYKAFCEFLGKYVSFVGEDEEKFINNIFQIFSEFLINFLQVPSENIILTNDGYDTRQLEIGMRKSWVWPSNLL